LVHWATGDRHAEAAALADRTNDVDEDAAETAVRRAHGDIEPDADEPPLERAAERDVASPADAEAAQTDVS
jgi:hypothetical protein